MPRSRTVGPMAMQPLGKGRLGGVGVFQLTEAPRQCPIVARLRKAFAYSCVVFGCHRYFGRPLSTVRAPGVNPQAVCSDAWGCSLASVGSESLSRRKRRVVRAPIPAHSCPVLATEAPPPAIVALQKNLDTQRLDGVSPRRTFTGTGAHLCAA
jgi:hypothetical protein